VQAEGFVGTVVAICTNGAWTYAGSCAGGLADINMHGMCCTTDAPSDASSVLVGVVYSLS
jgi:hypothetical protein